MKRRRSSRGKEEPPAIASPTHGYVLSFCIYGCMLCWGSVLFPDGVDEGVVLRPEPHRSDVPVQESEAA